VGLVVTAALAPPVSGTIAAKAAAVNAAFRNERIVTVATEVPSVRDRLPVWFFVAGMGRLLNNLTSRMKQPVGKSNRTVNRHSSTKGKVKLGQTSCPRVMSLSPVRHQ
jgi:hypothetical protein